jgi:predicted DsbA family dithiol-disulfide isomerase
MSERFERGVSLALAVAAIGIAATFAHKEFGSSGRGGRGYDPMDPPRYVNEWRSLVPTGHQSGDSLASVQVVEFGDLQCPACRLFSRTLRSAEQKYAGKIGHVFIHFPLSNHHFARPAAQALECASSQGRFAEMHDVLFDRQDSLGLKSWWSFAHEAGAKDSLAFGRCLADSASMAPVEAGLQLGNRFGVLATPTVIINGWRFASTPSPQVLAETIDALLAGRAPPKADKSLLQRLRSGS